jgi:NTP pyrophosphatase (non-canonical NTP hydrolase)
MDHKTFTQLALRTEQRLPAVVLDQADLESVLAALKEVGGMLDSVKKRAFYNRPINAAEWSARAKSLSFYGSLLLDHAPDTDRVEVTGVDPRVLHGVVGIVTEAVELAEALLLAIEGSELDRTNVIEELGDIDWYRAILLDAIGASEEEVRTRLLAKLATRYPEKYTDEAANTRDLAAERKALEA